MVEIKQKTRWERFKGVITPIFSGEPASGVLMAISVIIALILANSGWAEEFHEFWEYPLEYWRKYCGTELNATRIRERRAYGHLFLLYRT